MHVVIFHYHLQPGGVTDVITTMRRALLEYAPSVDRITLVCGSHDNVGALAAAADPAPQIEVLPELAYHSRQSLARYDRGADGDEQLSADASPSASTGSAPGPVGRVDNGTVARGTAELSRRIAKMLLERYGGGDAIWWVHNHHLGKNPALTHALYEVARTHPQRRIILHIHDFPECGRYANLRFLHAAGIAELYPSYPNLTWVVINSRDRELLERAGVEAVHYLPNPVETHAKGVRSVDRTVVRDRLARAFGTEFPAFDPDAPILLYPVRTIRRKNVLETGLLATILPQRANLVVTLPGVSHAEKKYSEIVEYAYREGLVAGLWGIGRRIEEAGIGFDELQRGADAIVSSSVQEGFGFQYITPLLLGIPLVARRLDIMGDVESLYDGRPHTLYDEIHVPVTGPTLSGPHALLRFRYTERIDRLRTALPEPVIARLLDELETLLSGDTIEYSYLPAEMQLAILRDVATTPSFKEEVRSINRSLIDNAASTAATTTHPAVDLVGDALGPLRFAAAAERVLTAARPEPPTARPESGKRIEESLLSAFAQLQYQRLLYS